MIHIIKKNSQQGLIWVNVTNKNKYYRSFKTWLGSRHETRFRSLVKRVNLSNPIFLKKKSKQLWFDHFVFKKNQWVFYNCFILSWLGFFTGLSQVNLSSIFSYTRTSSGSESTSQVSPDFITRVIIVLSISTLKIN